jgi:hypothetical protein
MQNDYNTDKQCKTFYCTILIFKKEINKKWYNKKF